MLYKIISVITAAVMLITTVAASGVKAATDPPREKATEKAPAEAPADDSDEAQPPRAVRMIEPDDEDRWQIVDVRHVRGALVVVSAAVGREIDLEESNRYSLFQGRTVYNRRFAMSVFEMAVPGFQSARFLKRGNGKYLVTVSFRSGKRIASRTVPIKDEDEIRRLREYIEHFREIQRGEYELLRESKLPADAEFPFVSDEVVSYEQRVPRYRIVHRVPGELILKDGERISGELVPAYANGRIMVQTKLDARWVEADEVERIRIRGEKSSAAVGSAVRNGVGGVVSGAAVGALGAWQWGGDVKETALLAAIVFGAVGFVSGLLRGAREGRGSREFVLGPVKPGERSAEDWGEGRRRR